MQLQKAVERGPAEHARVREVSALSAHLPDALIRFTPALADQLAKANQLFLRAAIERSSIAHEVQHRADHFAVEAELDLSRGRVANPDWPRAAVPAQMRQLVLLGRMSAVHVVEHLQLGP